MSEPREENKGTLELPEKSTAGSSTDSDVDKTIVEQYNDKKCVAELKEEIRMLKCSLEILMKNSGLSPATKAVPQNSSCAPTSTPAPSQYSFSSLPNETVTSSCLPLPQMLSMDQHYFNPNAKLHFFPAADKPLPSVPTSTYMPPSSNNIAIHMPLPSVPNSIYMPLSSNNMPQSYVPATTYLPPSSQNIPTHVPTSYQNLPHSNINLPQSSPYHFTPMSTNTNMPPGMCFANTTNSNTPQAPLTQVVYENRPIRKLCELPVFDGQPEQWPMFAVSYRETTQFYNYTKLENLSRLQRALRGDAKIKVEAHLIHPESVDHVMSTLEFHYGRPQIMIRSQIAKVRAFPTISGRKMSEITNFSTMVSNLTVFLENAGATAHLCNPTLLDELVGKLPLSKREEWARHSLHNLGQYPTVRQFSMWLNYVATYVSLATEADVNVGEAVTSKGGRVKPSFSITTLEGQQPNCSLCSQNHSIYYCTKFKNRSTADRWKFVKENHLCFGCLRAGHNSLKCNSRRQCGISGCTKHHNRLLHEENKNVSSTKCKQMNELASDGTLPIKPVDNNDRPSVTTIVDDCLSRKALFKYLPVRIKGPKGSLRIIAFIDDGSKISLLEEEVANEIGLKGPMSNLSLGWIGGKRCNEMSMQLNLEICNVKENEPSFQMKRVRTTSHLQLPPQTLHFNKFKEKFSVLKDMEIVNYVDATPKLLIGLPHVRLVRPYKVMNLDDNFSVHKTTLGNILFGSNEETTDTRVCVIDINPFDCIQKQVSEYFALEGFGMRPVKPLISNEDKRAEDILKKTTVRIGSQYETGLLWRKDDFDFNETYSMAYKRLQSVEARMKKDKDLAKWYNEKIEEYVEKRYARKLSPKEASIENCRTWYLPHFVITNVNKENKRRLVFDAASVVGEESFNTRIMKGPSKYQPKPLLSILFKFRQCQIGVCGDIREMFHRVNIREEDQTAQRFLWRGGLTDRPPDIYVMRAMIFGSASSPCSAQYVKNLNAEIFAKTDPRAYEAIVERHYVDDYVDSFDSIDIAISVTRKVISINKHAGFELRGFISNSPEVCHSVENGGCGQKSDLKSLCKDDKFTEKVLGMFWSPVDDTFCFILKFSKLPESVLIGNRIPTKSEVLSMTMSIFDPFGFLANVVIYSKMLLQELWKYNIDWNSPIPLRIYEKWYDWYKNLQNVQCIKIKRCYSPKFTDTSSNIELHVFVDASEMAFAAVGYWRIIWDGNVEIIFVAGKSRCAPIKTLSIPRLELQAAVLGVRLKEAIVSSHTVKPRRTLFWSDSKTVVKWIQSDSRIYKQFVSHRIAEILELSVVEQWRWVPGIQNPADKATRPQHVSEKTSDNCWLSGPEFLKREEEHWPNLLENRENLEGDNEIRSKFLMTVMASNPLITYNEKSQYYKLLRKRCWLMRAVNSFKCNVSQSNISYPKLPSYLTVKELNEAELHWCKTAQKDEFKKEYDCLKRGYPVGRKSPIYNLSPSIGADGLIRISGRIRNAVCIKQQTKEPIIMPKKHIITQLIVKQYHEDYIHQNQESICAAIRTKFWIPCIRQLVRAAKKNCQVCKNRSAAPNPPLMGQLPEDRITPFVRPYTYTGVDYIGPFTVAIGRRCEKRWVALFTCMTTRAIHIELAKDLSTDAVILCIRNFINRRGVPIRIRSDRGTNFVGASKENVVLDQAELGNECSRRGIEWIFNTPANPSAGGAWERMVRAVKNVLSFTLKEKTPQLETFHSLLIEAENLVNSRPLTHLPIESPDSEPLTPNHFILGCPNNVQTPAVNEKVCLRKQWHILQQLKQTFWRRWVLEYLPDLVRRTKWHQHVKPIQIGDIVIICDADEARGNWKRGVVEEVFTAADGQVRTAVVKTTIGKLRRPASKLAVLDVGGESPRSTHGRRDVIN